MLVRQVIDITVGIVLACVKQFSLIYRQKTVWPPNWINTKQGSIILLFKHMQAHMHVHMHVHIHMLDYDLPCCTVRGGLVAGFRLHKLNCTTESRTAVKSRQMTDLRHRRTTNKSAHLRRLWPQCLCEYIFTLHAINTTTVTSILLRTYHCNNCNISECMKLYWFINVIHIISKTSRIVNTGVYTTQVCPCLKWKIAKVFVFV